MAKDKNESGDMSVREAGQKGGEQTAKTHGKDFYKKIGHDGGVARGEQQQDKKDNKDDK